MSTKPTADEQPKQTIAKKVTAPKRRYFVPASGTSVSAVSPSEAVKKTKALKSKQQKEGDE